MRRQQRLCFWAERFFLAVGCLTLGFCALTYLEATLYQTSENRIFDNTPHLKQEFAPRAEPQFQPTVAGNITAQPPLEPVLSTPIRDGSPLSRIEIPRLGLSVVVVEGVRPRNLRLAVGHIPGTALPGESGNIGIAGHRDTFFRKLGQLHGQDRITLTTLRGSFEYTVESIEVVEPSNTQVLQASSEPTLTLVTCYPFYYVGPAPRRFVVKARQEATPELSVDPQ